MKNRSANRDAMWRRLVLALATLVVCGGLVVHAEDHRPATAAWLINARIGGAEVYADMTDEDIEQQVADLESQKVSVIEADSDFSRNLTEREFDVEIDVVRRYTEAVHKRGLKVVWYYPTLEVLSPDAKRRGSMFKSHPDWVQRGINGEPNVFYGGGGRVHWVEEGTESAWMSLHSPYGALLLQRIARVAAAGVDGIWLDVPLFNDIGTAWADVGPAAAAKFKADTGLATPKMVNWSDPVWRRWIAWRTDEITNFIRRIRDAATAAAGDVSVIVETVTMDYNSATMLGLDGSRFKTDPGITQVWEIDALSDESAMRDALPDDWISLIAMSKFATGASGGKPSWVFTYGLLPEDGLLVMGEALASGSNPYETKIPLMTSSIGPAYRKAMFSWIETQERRLFASSSVAKVAVLYSSESRDYVDRAEGSGLFATSTRRNSLWWSNERIDSVYMRTYLAEYRGIIKWLVRHHVPFDVIVRPDAQELARYDVVLAPSLAAISDSDAALLDRYVGRGGYLALTGPRPAGLDQIGTARAAPALASLSQRNAASGAGNVVHVTELIGKTYLISGSRPSDAAIARLFPPSYRSAVETDAGTSVHIELRSLENETLIHLINPERLWDANAPKVREITVSVALPAGQEVTNVQFTSPQKSRGAVIDIPFEVREERVSFKVPLEGYGMAVVTYAVARPAPSTVMGEPSNVSHSGVPSQRVE
jgi:hypothetical protein